MLAISLFMGRRQVREHRYTEDRATPPNPPMSTKLFTFRQSRLNNNNDNHNNNDNNDNNNDNNNDTHNNNEHTNNV